MVPISVSDLRIGAESPADLLNAKGIILFHSGVAITQALIESLQRKKIKKVFIRDEDQEVLKLLSVQQDVPLHQDSSPGVGDENQVDLTSTLKLENAEPDAPARALQDFPELENLEPGEKGLAQILTTGKAREADAKVEEEGAYEVKPAQTPLAAKATQMAPGERTDEYKRGMIRDYDEALALTEISLRSLRDGGNVDGKAIRRLVDHFVTTFVTDRNILINLSGIKAQSEDYLFNHSLNVCLLAINIAAAAGYERAQVIDVGMGALLHDIGMMLIPQSIRSKRGPLGEDEHYEVRKHPILGLHLLDKVSDIPELIAFSAYQHHERADGGGYPKQRDGRLHHPYARMVMIADVFEALSSPRAYRPARIPYKAMTSLLAFAGKNFFDRDLTKAFINYTSLFPVGSLVRLSTQEIAKVIHATGGHNTKPIVSVITDAPGNILADHEVFQIDLTRQSGITIVQALGNDVLKAETMKGF